MFQRFFDDGLAHASYLIACPRVREAVIIDPRRDVDVYVEAARAMNLKIVYSFETHIHADFVCGSRELLAVGARALAGPGSNLRYPHHEVQDGERVRVGDLSIQFIHTPGHTPEHISVLTSQPDQPVRIFSGDALFVGGVGRPDLLGEEQARKLAGQLYDSLFTKLLTLDDRIEVHPGHGAGSLCGAGIGNEPHTTIGQERRFNKMLQYTHKDAFVAAVLADLPDTPPYFPRMKKINQEGPPLLGLVNGYRGPAAIGPAAAASAVRSGALIVDLRGASAFAERHPLGALNLGYGTKVGYWAGWVLPADARVVLLAADERQAADAARQLLRVGVSRIDGYISGGMDAWAAAGLAIGNYSTMTAAELHAATARDESPLVVDVRSDREWNAGHIEGALHIPLGELARRASEIPRDRPVATLCEAGYRSALAASLLARAGVDRLSPVNGGMAAWRQLTENQGGDTNRRPTTVALELRIQRSEFSISQVPLPPGTRLAQYEVTSPLGSGGMGDVYRARDVRLQRDVALKVMSDHIAADPAMRQRFETEARAVAALSHPSILSIHELGFADGIPFAVMELLEGETLRHRIVRTALPWRDAVEISASIAEGLAAAHAKGIIHRDLKPENVFLTADGGVKILDFGLAVHRLEETGAIDLTAAHTAAGVVLGTLGYMSPEQVTGERVDGRSDVFAAGCLIYEMLTARRLFNGATPQEVVGALLSDTAPDLRGIDPAAHPELQRIVARCVHRRPDHRFASAADLALALRALLTGSAVKQTGARSKPRGKSLAVLPFVNSSGDPQIDYLTDGITESIINSLSQLPSLRVVPRSLVFRYKGLQVDPSTAGLALNARTILTGRVVQQGDFLDIQAELVDTANEAQLWGERFRRKTADVLLVQEEIAWQISEALRLKLSGEQRRKLRKRPTVDPEAYQEYLRGRHHWHNWSPESFQRAVEHFDRALEQDPGYALAYAGLGTVFGAMAYYGYMAPHDGFPRARAAALRALELDSRLADAHVTIGLERLFYGWDWQAAEAALKHALELDPDLALAHMIYCIFFITSGRFDEAMASARRARALDPLSPFVNMGLAWVHHFAGRPADAARESKDVLALSPGLEEAGNTLITAYESLGRYEDAAVQLDRQRFWGMTLDGATLLTAFNRGGPEAYWRERLAQMGRHQDAPAFVNAAFATAWCHLEDYDQALNYVERMVDAHVGGAVFIGVDRTLAKMRGLPRYDAVLRRVGSPLAQKA